jgi:hypothetical protein
MRVGTVVPDRTIVDDIGASVWAEPEVGRTVEPVDVCHERLVAGAVAGKVLDPQGEGGAWQLVEVDRCPATIFLDILASAIGPLARISHGK